MSSVVSAVVGLASTLLGGQKTPKEKKTPTAPTPDDEARRRAMERAAQRKQGVGREASTMLDKSNKLG